MLLAEPGFALLLPLDKCHGFPTRAPARKPVAILYFRDLKLSFLSMLSSDIDRAREAYRKGIKRLSKKPMMVPVIKNPTVKAPVNTSVVPSMGGSTASLRPLPWSQVLQVPSSLLASYSSLGSRTSLRTGSRWP